MKNYFMLFAMLGVLNACATSQISEKPSSKADELNLVQKTFSDLPSWSSDSFRDLASAYEKSCGSVLKRDSQKPFGPSPEFGLNQEWQINCRKFEKIDKNNSSEIRRFFENNFVPYMAMAGNNPEGLFTGYYEASLNGSRQKTERYKFPLRARPDDLVMVNLGAFREELKGQRIAGRVTNGNLRPYETHEEILNGELPAGQDKPLVWVDSAIDAFFIQIQGSGIVSFEDGSIMRVGYAGQNGHPYYAIGRELIKREALKKDNVSMQTIRQWMEENPDQAQDLMVTNKSYVFFTEVEGDGPLGGAGIPLTPGRSLAIDHSIIPYGMPVWVDLKSPANGGANNEQINKMMITQDTGGAIRGPVRGDYFWGYGSNAENMAGIMKSSGRYWFLLPKSL